MAADYVEAAGFLKLGFSEGEIDFIIAPYPTENPRLMTEVGGRRLYMETPEEIVLKKLFYCAETLKTRDVMDTAAIFAKRKEQLLRYADMLFSKLEFWSAGGQLKSIY